MRVISSIIVLSGFILSQLVVAQPLSLEIRDFKTQTLPVIRFKSLLVENGSPYQLPGNTTYTLTENGVPVDFSISCPGAAINSVAMVLDNSGSMSGKSITALSVAASQLVDSLHISDECMVQAYNGVLQDFTTDKSLLKNALVGLSPGGGTPLYATIWNALQALAQRPGRKFCVILTDGMDNGGGSTPQDIETFAIANSIVLYTIGFGNGGVSDRILQHMANVTGGIYYRIFTENRLNEVWNAIASDIISPACTVQYTASNCEDSVRVLEITASIGNRNATALEILQSPFRRDTLRLTVDAPESVMPGENIIVYFGLEPGLHKGLQLSFSFLIHFNPELLEIPSISTITVGTICQNTNANIRRIAPGLLQATAELVSPGIASGNLIGVRFRGMDADSSRPVEIFVDSLELIAGCPNTVLLAPDTIDVCRCWRAVPGYIEGRPLVTGSELRLPVLVSDTAFPVRGLFTSQIEYEEKYLTPIAVDGIDAISEGASLSWSVVRPGLLEVRSEGSFLPEPGELLYSITFRTTLPKSATTSSVALALVRAYTDCCPDTGVATAGAVLVDGLCDKIVRRRVRIDIEPLSPNPASSQTVASFTVHGHGGHADLEVFRSDGSPVTTAFAGELAQGRHLVTIDLQSLSPGTYYVVLTLGSASQTQKLVVVR